MDESEKSLSEEIINGASNMFGAFTSASIAAIDPAMAGTAGMAGVVVEETVRSILTRSLGYRDRKRVGAVLDQTQIRIQYHQSQGQSIRQDGFWEARGNIPPVGQEVFEAVLLAAQKEPQEKKIPYMGNLFAYIACRSEISDVSAHWLVKTAESLSWTQFELLALISRIDEVDASGITVGEGALTWDSVALHRELVDLGFGEKRLMIGKPVAKGYELPSEELDAQVFTESGRLLVIALGLEDIKGSRLDELVERLRRPLSEEKAP